jgi:MoaA/NifB/PqqE/SkfB family radical SAM enzyme
MNTKRLDLLLGYECNNNCLFCVNNNERTMKLRSDTNSIKRELKEKSNEGYDTVCFSGGEPTIRNDILDLIQYSRLRGYDEIQIITNGRMLMYQKFAHKLIEAGLNTILFSVHGPTQGVHDGLTQVTGSFNQTMRGIDNITNLKRKEDIRLKIWSNTTISKMNYFLLPDIVKMLKPKGIEICYFTFVNPYGSALDNFDLIVPKMSDTIPYIEKTIESGKKEGITIRTEGIPFCFMTKNINCVGESYYPKQWTINRINNLHKDFNLARKVQGKIKSKVCGSCIYTEKCEGVWVGYANKYGLRELLPVNK